MTDPLPATAGRPRKVGLFGGTFDPPHVGHLVTAVNVRHALELDVVVLMVANVPWQKESSRAITPALDRLAMVEAAVADVAGPGGRPPGDRPRRARASPPTRWPPSPSGSPAPTLFTIVGDDAAAGLATWERHEEVVARSTMVVVDRPGEPRAAGRRRAVDPRRGAPPRGVEHRPAGPLRRRPPARLPRHRPRAAGHRRAGPVRERRRDGASRHRRRRHHRRRRRHRRAGSSPPPPAGTSAP